MKKPFSIILSVITLFSMFFAALVYQPTYADVCSTNALESVKESAGCYGNTNALPNIIVNIIRAVILISGLIAVIFVIIGGVNYMTSSGDSSKLEKAKKTILYALIGLIIAALSFAIVNFTISNIISGQSNQETTEQENANSNEKPANA